MALEFLASYADYGFMALRFVLAAIFLYHGIPKLRNTKQVAKGMGFPAVFVALLGLTEVLGGLSVLLGVYARVGALALAVVMLGALYHKIVKWKSPFYAQDKVGWAYDLILLAAVSMILLAGAGSWVILV